MQINITAFFTAQIAPMDLSASIAEIGANAGAYTWAASVEAAQDLQLLTTPGELGAFRQFAQSSGGEFDDSTDWQALFLQWIAGDLREMGVRRSTDTIDWAEVEQLQEDGQCPINIFRGTDGQMYFDVSA